MFPFIEDFFWICLFHTPILNNKVDLFSNYAELRGVLDGTDFNVTAAHSKISFSKECVTKFKPSK